MEIEEVEYYYDSKRDGISLGEHIDSPNIPVYENIYYAFIDEFGKKTIVHYKTLRLTNKNIKRYGKRLSYIYKLDKRSIRYMKGIELLSNIWDLDLENKNGN